MSTVNDIITKTRWRIADSEDLAYDEDQIISALNDGLADLSETGFFQHLETEDSPGTTLAFSALDYKPRKILRIDTGTSQLLHSRIGEMQADTSVSAWVVWGQSIRFNAATSTTITVYYTAYPPTYTVASAQLDARIDPYISALSAFVEARLRLTDNDGEAYDKAMAEYMAFKANLSKTIEEQMINGGFAQ